MHHSPLYPEVVRDEQSIKSFVIAYQVEFVDCRTRANATSKYESQQSQTSGGDMCLANEWLRADKCPQSTTASTVATISQAPRLLHSNTATIPTGPISPYGSRIGNWPRYPIASVSLQVDEQSVVNVIRHGPAYSTSQTKTTDGTAPITNVCEIKAAQNQFKLDDFDRDSFDHSDRLSRSAKVYPETTSEMPTPEQITPIISKPELSVDDIFGELPLQTERTKELQNLALQPFCARHQSYRFSKISDASASTQQRLQQQCRARITCCCFEEPYLLSCGGKPAYRLAELAVFALMQHPDRRMTLNQIFKWICCRFSYYCDQIIDSLTAGAGSFATTWCSQLHSLFQSYDFPTEPVLIDGQVHFYLAPGREWTFLHRQRAKKRTFTRFCQLPREIRDLIYFWALPLRSSTGWTVPSNYIVNRHRLQLRNTPPDVFLATTVDYKWTLRSEQMRDLLSITRTSKQIHLEASSIFYGNTRFVFGDKRGHQILDGCKTMLGFLKGLNARDPSTREAVKHITLHYNPERRLNMCQAAFNLLAKTSLHTLHIHIDEDRLIGNGRPWKCVAQLPGMKKIGSLRGIKSLTTSGLAVGTRGHLDAITKPKARWADPDEANREARMTRQREIMKDIRRRLDQRIERKMKRTTGEAASLIAYEETRLVEERIRDDGIDSLKAKRAKRQQEQITDIFDVLSDNHGDLGPRPSKRRK